ncbi:MAG: endonuclease/exonuclease/phosphatase family protein [Rikenellaceae bacterium]
MEDYYYDRTARAPKKRSVVMVVIDTIMLVVSLIAFAAICLTLVTSYYDPSTHWIFPVLGLVSPATYLFTTLLMLYWVIRWRLIYACTLLLPLLVGAPNISHYGKIETAKHYGAPPRRGTIRLISYNTHGMVDRDKNVTTDQIEEFIEEQNMDIVCLQEFDKNRFKGKDYSDFLKKYYRAVVSQQAIFSRYKILETSDELLRDDSDSGSGFWVDLLISSDTVRLYNLHLHSTAITLSDDDYLSDMEFISDSQSEDKLKGMISRFRRSSIGRATQADSIATSIAASPYPVIVCGDFNDTPNSYAFRKISNGLQDTFQEAGTGYTYTYRGFMNLLRIDYILVDDIFEVLSYQEVDSLTLSDHLPVITTIKL